jgi:hypothetical protein
MLRDGVISQVVLDAVADEIGIPLTRRSDRSRARSVTALLDSGVLSDDGSGTFLIVHWRDFHSSREEVREARAKASSRKRKHRGQVQLPISTGAQEESVDDVTPDVTVGHARDSRVGARARAHSPSPAHAPTPSAAGNQENQELLGNPENQELPDSAAAESELVAPRESRIREVVEGLAGADYDSVSKVEGLGRQLPESVFEKVLERMLARRNVANQVGLFVDLLRKEVESRRRSEARKRELQTTTVRPAGAEAMIQLHVPSMAECADREVYDHVEHLLSHYAVSDENERTRLFGVAEAVLAAARARETHDVREAVAQ